jgi:hypothetical protein
MRSPDFAPALVIRFAFVKVRLEVAQSELSKLTGWPPVKDSNEEKGGKRRSEKIELASSATGDDKAF